MCDDGVSVSRQSDSCGERAKGAIRGESARDGEGRGGVNRKFT